MSEHIKTGLEIADECVRGFTEVIDEPSHKDWISVPWLKKEIKKMRSEVKHSHVPSYESLTKVLSLLEEKP